MLTTKAEQLRTFLTHKTPIGSNYEDFVSSFIEENVYSFYVNEENVDIDTLIRDLAEQGFNVIQSEKRKNLTFFRVKEV